MTAASDRVILVVEDDRTQLEALKILLTNTAFWRVEGVASGREALTRMQASPIAAVVTDEEMPGMDGLTMLTHMRQDTLTSHLPVVLLTASGEAEIWRRAWALGADAVLRKPTHPAVLRAAVEACIVRREEVVVLTETIRIAEQSIDRMIDLVLRQLEGLEPGAGRRGTSLSLLAERIAAQLEVEPEFMLPLERAARLYEIGPITTRMRVARPGTGWSGIQGRETAGSAALLRNIPSLDMVANLVEGMGANWDGSGFPNGMEKGQIPLRSRVLRVAADLQAVIAASPRDNMVSVEEAIAALEMRSGTWYDPAVISVLHRMVASSDGPVWDPDVDLVLPDDLRVGMELISDLNTASGVKLLSRGSVLSAPNLDLVRRRHERDPIPHRVAVRHRRDVPDGS